MTNINEILSSGGPYQSWNNARGIWMQFRESQEADVLDFIQSLSNESTSRGKAWEAEIHHLIQCIGIQGTLRNLETGEVIKDFAISRSSGALFHNFENINITADYWRPVSPIHKHATRTNPPLV